jgi:Family of unknown function (DUF6165)
MSAQIPVSWGELIDKITILKIKQSKMQGTALHSVERELSALEQVAAPVLDDEIRALADELRALNQALWDIEDRIRDKEAAKSFDAAFIELARAVYHTNDQRGAVKRRINLHLKSELMEEKQYRPY